METLSSPSAAIVSPSPSSFSIFSPKRKDAPPRIIRFPTSSKKNGNDSDLQSDSNSTSIVPLFGNQTFSKDEAMGLVLSAASVRGWTTGSGMEGPSIPAGTEDQSNTEKVSTFPWSLFTKSPRRRMRVAFTCNVCGQRTTRAINPHAYTDGTVFVQCCGCNVFHKLVDNLNLFHEMKCYVTPSFNYKGDHQWDGFKLFGGEEEEDDDNGNGVSYIN
ncbi:Zinc finger, DNL-type [Corchorus capsularis]|uniref:Zinc finger, DNL-type n=1 Tax=Corchorus capsularis TaxID=210143 RepID=A0A1R3IXL5_COCAP|nr:Zinc finger, DNL-type [Corchorus capsularis]